MTLMVNGKKVVGYALGGTEFYSIGENADGSISLNGQKYIDLANASFNITMLDYEGDEASDSGVVVTFSDLGNFFSKYSFYQILVQNIEGSFSAMTPLFLLKPNVQMPISVSRADSETQGSLILNVLADSAKEKIMVSSDIGGDGFYIQFSLYGYKIN